MSSCEAEIWATNKGGKLLMAIHNLSGAIKNAISSLLGDTSEPTTLYNDNKSCVIWSNSLTTKGVRHMEQHENLVREWVQDWLIKVAHVAGKLNPTDVFTKEMKDGAQFHYLRKSFMCSAQAFLQSSLDDIFCRQASVLP